MNEKSKPEKTAFFILPFGKKDIETVWSDVYLPTMTQLQFKPIRVDEQNDGRVVIDQIINYISTADLIIGDLTYERPNCYYELGYARGIRKPEEIVLCCRRDHIENFSTMASRPKVHFDLAAFGINLWEESDLDRFKSKFRKDIEGRMSQIQKHIDMKSSSESIPSRNYTKHYEKSSIEDVAKKFRDQWKNI